MLFCLSFKDLIVLLLSVETIYFKQCLNKRIIIIKKFFRRCIFIIIINFQGQKELLKFI